MDNRPLGQAILWATVMLASAIVLSDTPGAFARLLPILAGAAGGSIAIAGRRSDGRCLVEWLRGRRRSDGAV